LKLHIIPLEKDANVCALKGYEPDIHFLNKQAIHRIMKEQLQFFAGSSAEK